MTGVGGGLRKRRTGYFVQVPRETIRDKNLSWKARGLLAYLLDMPEGWDVRSEHLASEGPDGKDAVQSGLKDLRTYGYHRLERRRLRDGTFTMGTAISETPVESWIAENEEYGGRAVPVQQQPDGSFMVVHKDGSLTPDGFEDAALDDHHSTGTGLSGSGETDPGSTDSGQADVGEPRAIREIDTKGDPAGETEDKDRGGSTGAAAPAGTLPIPGAESSAADAAAGQDIPNITNRSKAEAVVRGWHAKYAAENGPVLNASRAHFAARGLVEQALTDGYTETEVKHALVGLNSPAPERGVFQRALGDVRSGRPVGGRSGRPEPTNVHHDDTRERTYKW